MTFGVDSQRYVVSTKGRPEMAHNLMQHLHHFAQNQAMIVAPTARRDIERHAVLAQMNHLSRTPEALSGALTDAQKLILSGAGQAVGDTQTNGAPAVDQAPPPTVSSAVSQFCTECGKPLPPAAAFCSACGARIVAG